MNHDSQIIINLLIACVFGGITAAVAHHKGRNVAGWFFVGFFTSCIGLIIIIAMSNLRVEKERWDHALTEQRRLREQLKQEQLKSQAFQGHVRARLDAHDGALGMDTRPLAGVEAGTPTPSIQAPDGEAALAPGSLSERTWFAQLGEAASDPMTFDQLRELYRLGKVRAESLVWTGGMQGWKPILEVPGLVEALL